MFTAGDIPGISGEATVVLATAKIFAENDGQQEVGLDYVLLAIASQEAPPWRSALEALSFESKALRAGIESAVRAHRTAPADKPGSCRVSSDVHNAIRTAEQIGNLRGLKPAVTLDTLLIGILDSAGSAPQRSAIDVLQKCGVQPESLRNELWSRLPPP